MREALSEGVERITGRKVVAFMSDNHIEPDMAVEVFVLDGATADSVLARRSEFLVAEVG